MTVEEFKKIDNKFQVSSFYSKVNNIFIKLMTDIMLNKLDEVKHFISNDLYDVIKKKIDDNTRLGIRQMFDELNVKDSNIIDIIVKENVYIIKVYLQSRYMNYIINLDNGNLVEGSNSFRIEKNYYLTFEKKINAKEQDIIRGCPGCGNSININDSGICKYCGAIYNLEDYDWILKNMEIG